jgi:glycine dehydrogenase subunit 1
MLAAIGCRSWDDLFQSVPDSIRLQQPLGLPEGKSELEVRRILEGLATQNKGFKTVFRGAGAYRHYIPSIVKSVTAKEEFLTAYTPYQAEISQGILQAIFEYQTMICELTGMEVANASVYDGATAAVEALAMVPGTETEPKRWLPPRLLTPGHRNHADLLPGRRGRTGDRP